MTVLPIDMECSVEAVIFDIQCFSLHDGPGIRTTVFFKGCPLDCIWCHNPESKNQKKELMFHRNLCVSCMCCVEACAYGVHTILDIGSELVHQVDQMKCTGCGKCLEVCCYDALSLMGREYSPEELYEKIKGDLRYFLLEGMDTKENGGVTFSGGEPMLYYRFIRAFCRLIPGVHRAIETSGYVPKEYFKYILDSIDLFLFDYKISDSRKHKQYCGVDNALILKNLDYIYSENKKIVLRLPLIPELNDEDEHFDGIAELLLSHPEIKRAEIMAYHNLGIGKTKELGLPVHEELPAKDADAVLIKHWLESLKSRGCANVYQS